MYNPTDGLTIISPAMSELNTDMFLHQLLAKITDIIVFNLMYAYLQSTWEGIIRKFKGGHLTIVLLFVVLGISRIICVLLYFIITTSSFNVWSISAAFFFCTNDNRLIHYSIVKRWQLNGDGD